MPKLNFTILTLFPEIFPGALGCSLAGKALGEGKWSLDVVNLRSFGAGKHQNVDDTPAGGGAGMVIRADVMGGAIDSLGNNVPQKLIYMSPRGKIFNQRKSQELIEAQNIVIICGRYEGLDQRVIDEYEIEEVSIGDFILSGGEVAAMAVIDACVRQVDGVLGNSSTLNEESFGCGEFENLLEYPLYTKPNSWRGRDIPQILTSGNHKLIKEWRLQKSEDITQKRRTDLWEKHLRNK